ncbi:glycosyltransferase [Rhodopirellula maiorica SM1]|uniref:Glycosyltransferase n=2 Tax=Novipirellula TaxID=2795426 RepID=M5RDD5_9BACT|nr:glycosyltransferase [Rhodopirellula maiorica SM1]
MRGGEKVLEQLCKMFPEAPIHCLVSEPNKLNGIISEKQIVSSLLQRVPAATRYYKHLLPFHPLAIANLRVAQGTDVLISSDAALIKGITVPENTLHICYCHSPPRYLWEMGEEYRRSSLAARFALNAFSKRLKAFDYRAAQNVTQFIANSEFVADRIRNYYDCDAVVVNPPVDVDAFDSTRPRDAHYLVVSELVPYKRIDIAVKAFADHPDRRLVVIGDGSERAKLQRIAGPNVTLMGRQPFAVLKEHYETARAFIFPGIEDFGITPVEAQAAGCPVIAFRKGGAMETVRDNETGIFFDEQSSKSLSDAIRVFERSQITPDQCRHNSERYTESIFRDRMKQTINATLERHGVKTGAA